MTSLFAPIQQQKRLQGLTALTATTFSSFRLTDTRLEWFRVPPMQQLVSAALCCCCFLMPSHESRCPQAGPLQTAAVCRNLNVMPAESEMCSWRGWPSWSKASR